KGTVQNMLDLDRAAGPFHGDKPLGALKLTIQKYYRVTGGTTQLQGVESDVVLPHPYQEIPYGERELDYPLAVDYVDPVVLEPKLPKPYLKVAQQRIAENPEFARIAEYAQWLKSQQDQTLVPLNYSAYFEREAKADAEAEAYDDLLVSKDSLAVTYTSVAFESSLDSGKVTEYSRWFKGLATDIYLGEAYRIVGEMPR
ncbi:MAG: carboxy terminal-processing peptidase, partial [Schleiferiaceae bacterium]